MTHEVKTGDFLILSSDGLFDNLYEDEIALIINNHLSTNLNTKEINEPKTVKYNQELLSSACELLIQRANKGNFFILK